MTLMTPRLFSLVVLDEAISFLDTDNEAQVQEALLRLMTDQTFSFGFALQVLFVNYPHSLFLKHIFF